MAALAMLPLVATEAMVGVAMVTMPMEEVATVVTTVAMAALPEATTAMVATEAMPLVVSSLGLLSHMCTCLNSLGRLFTYVHLGEAKKAAAAAALAQHMALSSRSHHTSTKVQGLYWYGSAPHHCLQPSIIPCACLVAQCVPRLVGQS